MSADPVDGDMVSGQKTTPRALTEVLERHLEEIAETWAEIAHHNSHLCQSDRWQGILGDLTRLGMRATLDHLRTGSTTALNTYVTTLSTICWQNGFTTGEATEFLLLSEDAVLPAIRCYVLDPDLIWRMLAEVNSCLRWMVAGFNQQYEAESTRRLRKQHEYIVSMINLGVRDSASIDIDEVLRRVAEGIIAAVDVNHCDFYLMDKHQGRLVPRRGISTTPPSAVMQQFFLSNPPDLAVDAFLSEVLARKVPLVSYNAQTDPRVNHKLIGYMGTKSILAVPLVANDRILAVAVTGTFDERRAFTDEQIELAWDVARAATLVIENARLYEQTRHVAALEERERLAREIHDNLAQALSILKLEASHIDDLIAQGQLEQARAFLAEMKATVTEAHIDAREAIFGLRHSASSAADFLPMLRTYLDRYHNTHGITARLVAQETATNDLSMTVVVQLTRIIQEALTNVRKHAGADAVVVQIERQAETLSVMVEDNGHGFDQIQARSNDCGGVGLQVMQERAESLGGQLTIVSFPGQGTRIVAQVPLQDRR